MLEKNTASEADKGERDVSQARVRRAGETARQLRARARRLGNRGVMCVVFPDQRTLSEWRARIAALA